MYLLGRVFKEKNNILDFALFMILFGIMQVVYPLFIVENYSYMGYFFHYDFIKWVLANISLLAFVLLIIKLDNISFFISGLFSMFLLFPNAVLFAFHPLYKPIIYLYVLIFMFLLWYVFRFSKIKISIPKVYIKESIIDYILIILGILSIFPFFLKFGLAFDWKVFLFGKEVYEVRKIANAHNTHLMSYLFSNIVKVLFPVGMIWFLSRKKYVFFLLFVFFQIYLFMVEGHKSVFLSLPLVLLMFIPSYRTQMRTILFFTIFLFSFGFFLYLYNGSLIIESILYRRAFLTPALLNIMYFDFFSFHKVYLTHSILSFFIENPYNLSPPFIIGEYFFDNPSMSANNGFIADGFANFGHLGVLFYSLLVVLYFKFFSNLNVSFKYSGLTFIIIYTFLSTALTTMILTHGLLLFTILMWMLGKRN